MATVAARSARSRQTALAAVPAHAAIDARSCRVDQFAATKQQDAVATEAAGATFTALAAVTASAAVAAISTDGDAESTKTTIPAAATVASAPTIATVGGRAAAAGAAADLEMVEDPRIDARDQPGRPASAGGAVGAVETLSAIATSAPISARPTAKACLQAVPPPATRPTRSSRP